MFSPYCDSVLNWTGRICPPPAITVDKGHGRIETRRVRTTTSLNAYLTWPHVRQVFRIDRHVMDLQRGTTHDETAYGITDLAPTEADAERIGALVRNQSLGY